MKYLGYLSAVFFLITALNRDLFLDPDRELQREAVLATEENCSSWKVEFLLWRGADPLYRGYSSYSNIEWALMRGNLTLVERLSNLLDRTEKEWLFSRYSRFGSHLSSQNELYRSKLNAILFNSKQDQTLSERLRSSGSVLSEKQPVG